jgi:hypothetical protein
MHSFTELRSGAPDLKPLNRIRAQVEEIGAQIEETAGAHWPHDVIAARLEREIGAQLDNASYRMRTFTTPGHFALPGPEDHVGFLAWLFGPEELRQRIRARIKELAPKPGLPQAEREAALAKLRAKERELLKAEEIETCRLEARGFIVDRRRHPDIGLLLEVWEEL